MIAIVLCLIGSSSAQTLQDFEYSGVLEDASADTKIEVTGGESISGGLSFDSTASNPQPGVFELVLSSDELGVEGPELDVSASLGGQPLECRSLSLSNSSVAYRCLNSSTNEIVQDRNTLSFSASVDPRIVSGRYSLRASVRSVVGEGEVIGDENVSTNGTVRVENEDVSVRVNSSSNASVEVKEIEEISASPPEETAGATFAGGVSVDVSNKSGQVDSSGSVSVMYEDDSLDGRDLEVFFYNDTQDQNRWVNVGGRQYPDNNTVLASVDHFSTYAAYSTGQDSETDSETDSGGGGGSGIDLDFSEEEDTSEDQEEVPVQDRPDESSEEEDVPEQDSTPPPSEENTSDGGVSDPDLPGSVEIDGGDETRGTPTGRFVSGQTPLVVSVSLLLIGAVLYLRRRKAVEVLRSVRQRL